MVYTRRRKTTKRTKKAKPMGKVGTALGYAMKALTIAKFVKGLVNAEYKKHPVYLATTQVGTTANISLLTAMAQGVTSETRNGNSIKASGINIKLILKRNTVDAIFRCMLILDKASNGTVPTTAEILDTTTVPGYLAHYNADNSYSRFIILDDKRYTLTADRPDVNLSFNHKFFHHVKFDGTGSTQADAVQGHLYLLLVSDEATDSPYAQYSSEFRFIDN